MDVLSVHDMFNQLQDELTRRAAVKNPHTELRYQLLATAVDMLHHDYAEVERGEMLRGENAA